MSGPVLGPGNTGMHKPSWSSYFSGEDRKWTPVMWRSDSASRKDRTEWGERGRMGWSFLGRLVREGCSEGRRRFCKNLTPGRGNSECRDHESGSSSRRTCLVCWRKSKKACLTGAERTKWRMTGVDDEEVDGPERSGPLARDFTGNVIGGRGAFEVELWRDLMYVSQISFLPLRGTLTTGKARSEALGSLGSNHLWLPACSSWSIVGREEPAGTIYLFI